MTSEKLEKYRQYIVSQFGRKAKIGCVVNQLSEDDLRKSLEKFPSIEFNFFCPLKDSSLVILSLTNVDIVDSLLQQDWLLKIDMTNVNND